MNKNYTTMTVLASVAMLAVMSYVTDTAYSESDVSELYELSFNATNSVIEIDFDVNTIDDTSTLKKIMFKVSPHGTLEGGISHQIARKDLVGLYSYNDTVTITETNAGKPLKPDQKYDVFLIVVHEDHDKNYKTEVETITMNTFAHHDSTNKVIIKPEHDYTRVKVTWNFAHSLDEIEHCISKTELWTYQDNSTKRYHFVGEDKGLFVNGTLFRNIPNLDDAIVPCTGSITVNTKHMDEISSDKYRMFTTFAFVLKDDVKHMYHNHPSLEGKKSKIFLINEAAYSFWKYDYHDYRHDVCHPNSALETQKYTYLFADLWGIQKGTIDTNSVCR